MSRFISAILLLFIAMVYATGQVQTLNNDTSTPTPGVGHDYIKLFGETVNPVNGSVNLRIDVPLPKGRGLDIPFAILYSSSGVHHLEDAGPTPGLTFFTETGQSTGSGWSYSVPTLTAVRSSTSYYYPGPPPATYTCYFISGYVFRDWNGSTHSLPLKVVQDPYRNDCYRMQQWTSPPVDQLTGYDFADQAVTTSGGTNNGYFADSLTPTKFAAMDGTVYSFPGGGGCIYNALGVCSFFQTGSTEDRNGNFVGIGLVKDINTQATSGGISDSAGRTAVSISNIASNQNTITVSGLSSPYIQQWYTAPSGYSVGTTAIGPVPCSSVTPSNTAGSYVLQTLTLPNGQHYQFEYDTTYGLLKKITYPNGAYVSYTWGINSRSEYMTYHAYQGGTVFTCKITYDTPAITQRTVSFDGVNIALQQTFSYSTVWQDYGTYYGWSSKQTTVTTYDRLRGNSFQTIYNYTPAGSFPGMSWAVYTPTERSIVYKDFNGSTLKTVTKGFLAPNQINCQAETLDTGTTSGAWFSYSSGNGQYGGLLRLADKKEFDYGQVSSSACNNVDPAPSGVTPARQMSLSYQSFAATPIFPSSPSIVDRPSSMITYSNGARVAETDYAYDQTAVTSASSPLAHDAANYGPGSGAPRGNLTTATNQCFQGGQGCTNSVSTYTFDETGQVASMTDPCGNATCSDMTGTSHTTTYSYADSYTSGGTPPGNTNAYLTRITYPTVNGVAQTRNFSYDYANGQLTVGTDANGRSTSYTYNDPFARPKNVAYPDGGQTAYAYSDAGSNPSVTATKSVAAGVNLTTVGVTDGMGHLIQNQTSDPEGTDYSDIIYDGLQRVWRKSNPHRSSASSSDGTAVFTYNALGKIRSITQADGSIVNTVYTGNCTTVTDEANNPRKSCADAFGRIVEVNEPGKGADTIIPATAGNGSVTISGTLQGTGGTVSHGSVTISGTVARKYICDGLAVQSQQSSGLQPQACPGGYYVYNSGDVTITVGTFAKSAFYGYGSTSATVASALVNAFNADGSSPVTAQLSGSVVNLTSKSTGTAANYSLSTSCTYDTEFFTSCSLTGTRSGPNMTGGTNGTNDSGTTNITINGQQVSYPWSGSGTTAASIASGLASAINSSSSYATAGVAGTTVNLTARTTGAGTNYSLSTSTAQQYGSFSSTASGAAFTGGTDQQTIPGTYSLSTPYVTLYRYDGLGNLACAVQKGTDTAAFTTCAAAPATWRPRSFAYDSLSRLTSATNPESGTISYTNDTNGNVATKIAPMPNKIPADASAPQTVTTTYSYDTLNRLIRKTYSDGTATVQYGYDGATLSGCTYSVPTLSDSNPLGRRTSMCDTSGATRWALDITSGVGWKTTEARNIGGVTKTIVTQDNVGGLLSQLTYPSGRTVTYTPSSAARYLSAVDTANGINYAQNATYAPFGALTGMIHGSVPITVSNSYNERLQPAVLSAGTTSATIMSLSYDFHRTNGDNGNIFQIINNRDNGRSQSFAYDGLNRIATALSQASSGSTCWGQGFTIDPWGNLTNVSVTKCSAFTFNAPATTANQISGYCYDKAGNLLGTNSCPSLPYTPAYLYDAENRLQSANGVTYVYDGDGNRVKKSSGTLYWGTGQLAESDFSATSTSWREYVFINDKRIARRDASNGSVHYYFSDHLGSTSIITNSSGTMPPEQDMDYYPYGSVAYGSAADHYMFTGKERDTESGLDNFDFRYYSSSLGRFIKPDDPAADLNLNNPQSLNLYSYVRNNPLRYTDPTGHTCQTNSDGTVYDDGDGKGCNVVDQQNKAAHASATVNGCEGEGAVFCLSFMVSDLTTLQSVSEVGVKGTTYAGIALGVGEIASAISGARAASQIATAKALADVIPGLPGFPAASRAALEAAANSGGETITVVTNLTRAPAAGRGLSVAVGDGAEALAGAARSGGQTFTAQIPKSLVKLLERSGLARESVTDMGGAAAREIRFAPQATEFVVKFFK